MLVNKAKVGFIKYYLYGLSLVSSAICSSCWAPVKLKSEKDLAMGYPESSKVLYEAISKAVEKEFGVFGQAAVKRSLAIKYWNSETGNRAVRLQAVA